MLTATKVQSWKMDTTIPCESSATWFLKYVTKAKGNESLSISIGYFKMRMDEFKKIVRDAIKTAIHKHNETAKG